MNKEIQHCPSCGQSVNKRQISLFTEMVECLWKVYLWCEENDRHEFRKKEIEHLLTKSVQANFAYWRWFGGLAYNPDGVQGHYGLNMERCQKFFSGQLTIPLELWKDPLSPELEHGEMGTINDIPNLSAFLDGDLNYITRYKGGQQKLI